MVSNKVGYKCFVIHGGISDRIDLSYLNSEELKRHEFRSLTLRNYENKVKQKAAEQISDIMWSDPIPRETADVPANGCYPNGKYYFYRQVINSFYNYLKMFSFLKLKLNLN